MNTRRRRVSITRPPPAPVRQAEPDRKGQPGRADHAPTVAPAPAVSPRQAAEHLRLMRRAGQGDSNAFARLYFAYASPVAGFLARRVGQADLVDDLTQEVFLRAWTGASGFRADCAVKTYLLAIAKNVAREAIHQRRRQSGPVLARGHVMSCSPRPIQDLVGLTSITAEEANEALRHRIAAAFESLPPKARQAVELVALIGLSRPEAAKVAGCSRNALRVRLFCGLDALRTTLGQKG